jgi:hypothetical protein
VAYSTTSKFVQLTPYLLMEWMYADQPDPETYPVNTGSTTVGFNKMVNGYITAIVNNASIVPTNQIYNLDINYPVTHNTAENSVVQIATNSFITLDPGLIIPFNDFSDELTPTDQLQINFPANIQVVYDSIRYHIVAGYNLSNLDGIIINVKYQDVNLTYVTFSQILIQKGTQQVYTLNPTPLKIGANIYDRYLEVKVPSLVAMNNSYQAAAASFRTQTLAALTSQSGRGYVYGAPIRIELWTVASKSDYLGYERYDSELTSALSLESEDPFSNIGAVIKESDSGQFFEYFATDNQGFVEDFILFQNSIGNNYYINHQIETLEQIGVAIITTNTFQTIQTTGFDVPNYYRPIVKNAATASSFTLKYTMSLVNTVDNSRVVRIGTYTSANPGQWGPNITPIKLNTFPQVMKIYNKVYNQAPLNIPAPVNPTPTEIVKVSNVFIDSRNVSTTSIPLIIRNGSIQNDTSAAPTVAQSAGTMVIDVSPFDNYYKFKMYKSGSDGSPVEIDLGDTVNYKMVFIDNTGKKIYVPSLQDKNLANSSKGEVAFRIDDSISSTILQLRDRRFFIAQGGDPVSTVESVQTNPNVNVTVTTNT